MIGKGQHKPTFVISTRSDAELNSNLRRRAGLMILAGRHWLWYTLPLYPFTFAYSSGDLQTGPRRE
jgi:hypothetical protein